MADTEQPLEQPAPTDVPDVTAPPPVEEPVAAEVAAEPVIAAPALPKQPPIQNQFLPEDSEFTLAKSFLTSKVGVKHPVSLYDHLTNIIMQTLETRNTNIVGNKVPNVDNFEQLSLQIKRGQFSADPLAATSVRVEKEIDIQHPVAKNRLEILKVSINSSRNRDQKIQTMLEKFQI
jgi:hypothetical protein